MTSTSWHADTELLDRYARGDVDSASAFSLESHLLACEQCRAQMAPQVDTERLTSTWAEIEAAVDLPRPGPVEWLLLHLGLRPHFARLLAATPALRLSWLGSVALALAFASAAAHGSRDEKALLVFLLLAPLLPVAGVAAAFSPGLDPAYELTVSSPFGGFRLLLVRSVAVLSATAALAGVAALTLPGFHALAAAWLLPALALSAASVALATFVAPFTAAGVVATVWVGGVLMSEIVASGGVRTALAAGPIESAAFHLGGQLGFLLLAAVCAGIVAGRRHTFELGRTS